MTDKQLDQVGRVKRKRRLGRLVLSQLLAASVAALLAGCANPGIVQISADTFMLAKTDRRGIFGNSSGLKAEVVSEANAFAAERGKVAVALVGRETPMQPGRFAAFEYQFRLVDPDSPEARGGSTRETSVSVQVNSQAPRDLHAELLKLDDLRKRGLLTEAEFETQKRRLLKP